MTRADHLSGTDRVAEVASAENAEIVVNIQGDEPLIDPAAIDAAILPMVHEPELVMGTLKKRIEDPREITDPNVVKVVTDHAGDAIYFSRCPIPFEREKSRQHALFQAHRAVRLPARIPAGVFRAAGGSAGNRGTPGAVARVGKRVSTSAWWKPNTNRWVWIPRRIWKGCPGCSTPQFYRGWEMAKYIFVTGGVVSSLGKGIAGRVDRLPAGKPWTRRSRARSSIPT